MGHKKESISGRGRKKWGGETVVNPIKLRELMEALAISRLALTSIFSIWRFPENEAMWSGVAWQRYLRHDIGFHF